MLNQFNCCSQLPILALEMIPEETRTGDAKCLKRQRQQSDRRFGESNEKRKRRRISNRRSNDTSSVYSRIGELLADPVRKSSSQAERLSSRLCKEP